MAQKGVRVRVRGLASPVNVSIPYSDAGTRPSVFPCPLLSLLSPAPASLGTSFVERQATCFHPCEGYVDRKMVTVLPSPFLRAGSRRRLQGASAAGKCMFWNTTRDQLSDEGCVPLALALSSGS